jgi:hypothetical protein
MRVKAAAYVRNEDMRRILNKAECEPGDEFELPDDLAEIYLKNGWAVPVRTLLKSAVEFAVLPGAPETAVSARGRKRRTEM